MSTITPRRYDYPWWRDLNRYYFRQLWDRFDPGHWDTFRTRFDGPGIRSLDPLTQEFFVIAIDSVIDFVEPGPDAHIQVALDLGASVRKIYDVVNSVAEYGGVHATTRGTNAIARVILERERLGEPVVYTGAEADAGAGGRLAEHEPWMDLLAQVDAPRLRGILNWRAAEGTAHELDARTQALIVLVVVTVRGYPAAELRFHVQRALDLGATKDEVVEAIVTAGQFEGPHLMEAALRAALDLLS